MKLEKPQRKTWNLHLTDLTKYPAFISVIKDTFIVPENGDDIFLREGIFTAYKKQICYETKSILCKGFLTPHPLVKPQVEQQSKRKVKLK